MPDLPPKPAGWKRPGSWRELSGFKGGPVRIAHAVSADGPPIWREAYLINVETREGKSRMAMVRLGHGIMEVTSLGAFLIEKQAAEEIQQRRHG